MSHFIFVLDFSYVAHKDYRTSDQKDHIANTYPSSYIGFLRAKLKAAVAVGRNSYSSAQIDSKRDDKYNNNA